MPEPALRTLQTGGRYQGTPFDLQEQLDAEFIPFGDWLPDVAPLGHPGCLNARNCVPRTNSYGEMRGLAAVTEGGVLPSRVLAHTWAQGRDASYHNFCATETNIYRLVNPTADEDEGEEVWSDMNATGVSYAAAGWEFVTWGDLVIAFSREHPPQFINVEDSTARFADLPGDPPTAKRAAIVSDFLMTGDVSGNPNRVHWSGYDNIETWASSIRTQADFQDLPSHLGRVQRIMPGEFGLVFLDHGVVRMDLAGGEASVLVFTVDAQEQVLGTPAPESVCKQGNNVFFFSHGGFMRFDGAQMVPIGANRVDEWFRAEVSRAQLRNIQGVVDRTGRLVLWGFTSERAGGDTFDSYLVYNWVSDRWSHARMGSGENGLLSCELLTEYIPTSVTLEQLTTPLDAPGQASWDSDAYLDSVISVACFLTTHQLGVFGGDALRAEFETREVGAPSRRLRCVGIRPVIDRMDGGSGDEVTAYVAHRDQLSDLSSERTTAAPVYPASGVSPQNISSRYQRYGVFVSGGFEHAHGCVPELRLEGRH